MFINYIKVALRNLYRDKLFSAINIGGLAVGIASVIMIFLFVRDELSYDGFWTDADQIYRMEVDINVPGRLPETWAVTAGPIHEALLKDYTEIDSASRLLANRLVVTYNGNNYFENVGAVNANFFDMFDMPVEDGNASAAISDTSSVVITRRTAIKYFGSGNAIGNDIEVQINGVTHTYIVGAVIANLPQNTHFTSDIFLLFNRGNYLNSNGTSFADNWGNTSFYNYIKLKQNADVIALGHDLDDFTNRNSPSQMTDGVGYEMSDIFGHYLVNIQDIYLKGAQSGRMKAGGDYTSVQTFIAIAGLILLISSINFINLSTAKSVLRSKEISLRKVFGADRLNIIFQFLGETLVVTTLALSIALVMVYVTLPSFNAMILRLIETNFMSDPFFLTPLAGLMVVVVLGAGFYPSFVVSSFRPADALRARRSSGTYSGKMRSFFVILQFAISIGLIISSTIIYQQTQLATSMDLGYEKDNIMVLRGVNNNTEEPSSQLDALKNRMQQHGDITSVSYSSAIPFDAYNNFASIYLPHLQGSDPQRINLRYVDQDYFPTLSVDMLNGRNFDPQYSLDRMLPRNADGSLINSTQSAIINEAAVSKLGFNSNSDAIGKIVSWGQGENTRQLAIVGIIPDIHIMPTTYVDEPMMYLWFTPGVNSMIIRFNTPDINALGSWVDQAWTDVVPDRPIQRSFLNEQIVAAYEGYQTRAQILAVFSILALIVSSLGLFGLASFDTQKRTLEVGIRKVMGASVGKIARLLMWQFSQPVMIANIIAWPVAWYFMSDWLQGFVYRISLNPLIFIGAGFGTLLIAWTTVGIHAFLVARTNPIKALKHE